MMKCMEMIDVQNSGDITQEDFIQRNSAIYEGIEVQNMKIQITEYNENEKTVKYESSFDTAAGTVSFENEAVFTNGEDGYKLVWDDSLIFPELGTNDKVRISSTQAERGQILDRNGNVLQEKVLFHLWVLYLENWKKEISQFRRLRIFLGLQRKALRRNCQQTGKR